MSGWPCVRLNDVLRLDLDPHPVRAGHTYPNIGIYSFGRGTFIKPTIEAGATSATTLYRVRAGQLIYSRLFAFEGAYTTVPDAHDGCYVSNEFPTFTADPERVSPSYLGWLFRWPATWRALRATSVGLGDRRQRIHPEMLLAHSTMLPPLPEQRRIVARLDAAEARVARVTKLCAEMRHDLSSLIVRANDTSRARIVTLGDALDLQENRTELEPGASYPQVGIRGFGGGLFAKGPVDAASTTYKHFNRLEAGQFVVSQVKGWEGAVAVCDERHAGLFASPEYRTFRCRPDVLRSTYLAYLCRTPWFHAKLAPATRGQGARRERLRPEMLRDVSLPLPDVGMQAELEEAFARVDQINTVLADAQLDALLPAMLHEVFGVQS